MKAVVLAGGKSSRMGKNKALMMLGGKPVIQHILDTISPFFDDVYISGSNFHYDFLLKGIIEDSMEQKGPIGGIYSALEYCKEDIFVCSCDMPFISSELIYDILQRKMENRINVVQFREKLYPVLGIYPYSSMDAIRKAIDNEKLRMTALLQEHQANFIQYENDLEDQLLNINTLENFRKAEIILNQFL